MATPGTITDTQLARLTGLTERRLRQLANEGWLPKPTERRYPLVEAISGLLRYYREQVENPTVRDVYPSFEACAAGTGIPVALLKRAKRQGCPALSGNQVEMEPVLRWWYAAGKEKAADYDRERAEQLMLQNHKLRVALRRLKRELVPAEDVQRLGAELGSAIRKVLTRLHRAAPSLEGRKADLIEARLREQEEEVLAQLQIIEDRLAAWHEVAAG